MIWGADQVSDELWTDRETGVKTGCNERGVEEVVHQSALFDAVGKWRSFASEVGLLHFL